MNTMKSKFPALSLGKFLLTLLVTASFVIGIWLLWSVLKSGYGYQFDIDELHHANLVYLYVHGYKPYKDIYNSFYTPVFELVLMPAFLLFGFSFTTIAFTRYIMVLLFVVRLVAGYFFVRQVFTKRTAWFFLPLFILDPFLVYSGMQIRPDNLMMTMYTLALMFLSFGMKSKRVRELAASAFLFGLSILTFMKIAPAVGVVILIYFIYCYFKKTMHSLLPMGLAFLAPFILFALYGVSIGALHEMIQQLIVESGAAYNVFRYPIPFGNFNAPNNILLYGTMGMPLSWIYVWILPLVGFAGFYHVIREIISKHSLNGTETIRVMLCVTLIAQLIVVFNVPSVFLQHYLLINWMFALFAGVVLNDFLTMLETRKVFQITAMLILFFIYIALAKEGVTNNITRSTISSGDMITRYETVWAQIPPTESVFPNYLFRPPSYPVPFGYFIGNVPPVIMNRLPSITQMLEEKKLQHLVLDDYTRALLPDDVELYISDHYARVGDDKELMVRKSE